jgi:CubicO group peptidase (beta-lactamase class C family)
VTTSPLEQVSEWPVTAAAVAVVTADGPLARTTGDADAAEFPWASVTKLLTALVVLDAVREGTLDLDEPAGPPGATVRHLLAHASGVAPDDDTVMSAPGRRRIYSNRGFELLADLVVERTGQSFDARMAERITGPLGLTRTRLDGSPAHGARGPLSDLAALGRALLAGDALGADARPELLAEATRVAFPGLAGVLPGFGRQDPNDWGLGFEIRGTKKPHWTGSRNSAETYGHFGRSGSFLWVDPVARLACVALTDREFGPWAATAWPALSDDVLAAWAPGAARPAG